MLFIPQFVMSCVTFREPGSVMQVAVQAPFPGEPQAPPLLLQLYFPTLHAVSVSHPSLFLGIYYYYYYYY